MQAHLIAIEEEVIEEGILQHFSISVEIVQVPLLIDQVSATIVLVAIDVLTLVKYFIHLYFLNK